MNTRIRRTAGLFAATAVLPLALTACSSDSSDSGAADSSDKASASATTSSDETGSDSGSNASTMDQPFGPACSAVPKNGAGSFDGMAKDPVATAASHNPALSTLVTAVKKAGLVDTLNNAQNITVFAPTNDAFGKIPKATLDKVLNDKAQLTKILTYHVVGQKLTPKDLENGSFDTLEKSKVTTSGSGDSYTVG
ncbi:fasciclin domain-containing protein, partial [Streptomyces capoamus]